MHSPGKLEGPCLLAINTEDVYGNSKETIIWLVSKAEIREIRTVVTTREMEV